MTTGLRLDGLRFARKAVNGIRWQIINTATGGAERHADARETAEVL